MVGRSRDIERAVPAAEMDAVSVEAVGIAIIGMVSVHVRELIRRWPWQNGACRPESTRS